MFLYPGPSVCLQQQVVSVTSLLQRSDSELHLYVEQYLDDKSPLWYLDRKGNKTVDIDLLVILARAKPWVLPILEKRLGEWMIDQDANKHLIRPLSIAIADEGSKRGLDAIGRLFAGHPEEPMLVRIALLSGFDYPFHNHYSLWYHALDFQNGVVRELAEKMLGEMVSDGSEHRLTKWAEALLDRYGHPPNELEFLTDPLVKLAWSHDRANASEIQRKLSVLTNEIAKKRKGGVQK